MVLQSSHPLIEGRCLTGNLEWVRKKRGKIVLRGLIYQQDIKKTRRISSRERMYSHLGRGRQCDHVEKAHKAIANFGLAHRGLRC